jgi:hypothetical protein
MISTPAVTKVGAEGLEPPTPCLSGCPSTLARGLLVRLHPGRSPLPVTAERQSCCSLLLQSLTEADQPQEAYRRVSVLLSVGQV